MSASDNAQTFHDHESRVQTANSRVNDLLTETIMVHSVI